MAHDSEGWRVPAAWRMPEVQMFEVILDYAESSRPAWVTGDLISKGENDGFLRLAKRKKSKTKIFV